MVSTSRIRTKLQRKIFNLPTDTPPAYGQLVTLIKHLSPTYNTRGEEEHYASTTSSITIVPFNLDQDVRTFEQMGNLRTGEFGFLAPYNSAVAATDELLLSTGEYWTVSEVQYSDLPDNVVVIGKATKKTA